MVHNLLIRYQQHKIYVRSPLAMRAPGMLGPHVLSRLGKQTVPQARLA